MKLKKAPMLLAIMLIFLNISPSYAETQKIEASTNLEERNTGIETIYMSLDEAINIMKTKGVRAETAELNKKSDLAIANGYSEKYTKIKKTLEDIETLENLPDSYLNYLGYTRSQVIKLSFDAQTAGASENNKKVLDLRKKFANANFENNYQADMNKIEQETIKMYSTVVLAEDNYKISGENLLAQKSNLKKIVLKKNVGLLSKKDVLQAQNLCMEAEKELRNAQTKMEFAKMSFNYLLGFNVIDKVVFTDNIKENEKLEINLEKYVENALINRNEIKGADFAKEIYQILLNDVKGYPKSSSTYLNAQINLLTSEKTAKDARTQIEIDVRNKAAMVEDKRAYMVAAKTLEAYAEEGLRLIKLTNEEGMSTVEELLNGQVNLYKAKLNSSKAISEYNISIKELEDSQGIGTMRIPL